MFFQIGGDLVFYDTCPLIRRSLGCHVTPINLIGGGPVVNYNMIIIQLKQLFYPRRPSLFFSAPFNVCVFV